MGSGYSKMKKQRKLLENQFANLQDEMQNSEFVGSAGNGLVKVVLNGNKQMKSIKIDPSCVDQKDVDGLEDLIVAAFKDASYKIEESTSNANLGMF